MPRLSLCTQKMSILVPANGFSASMVACCCSAGIRSGSTCDNTSLPSFNSASALVTSWRAAFAVIMAMPAASTACFRALSDSTSLPSACASLFESASLDFFSSVIRCISRTDGTRKSIATRNSSSGRLMRSSLSALLSGSLKTFTTSTKLNVNHTIPAMVVSITIIKPS